MGAKSEAMQVLPTDTVCRRERYSSLYAVRLPIGGGKSVRFGNGATAAKAWGQALAMWRDDHGGLRSDVEAGRMRIGFGVCDRCGERASVRMAGKRKGVTAQYITKPRRFCRACCSDRSVSCRLEYQYPGGQWNDGTEPGSLAPEQEEPADE